MKKVLVIEDEELMRAIIRETLDGGGFSSIAANDGQAGIRLAREHRPDLILCDVEMPGLDGYGVLRALRENSVTAGIPFVFLTGRADRTHQRQGMELGADDYLTKPFKPTELLRAASARLEKQAADSRRSQDKLDALRGSIATSLPHELLTPLNGILGSAAILMEGFDSLAPAEVLEMAELIHHSGESLQRMVQNFLLYAELELAAVDPAKLESLRSHEVEFSKPIIAEAALEKARQTGRSDDLRLDLEDAAIQVAECYLRKIVDDLLDNAFKYSASGTAVRVASESKEAVFRLYIADQGRGMTDAQIGAIGAYMQFERKLYEQQGSGLGLAIARRLAELHGGGLSIESAPGKGTTVCVALPAADGGRRA